MSRKCGRPPKSADAQENKQQLIDAAIHIIEKHGAEAVTVRNVCAEADLSIGTFYYYFQNKDDLLMYFLRETSFDSFELQTPVAQIADRISELYMHLIRQYMRLGKEFMKSFYTTGNQALSAYMGEQDGRFAPGTVMERSEAEITAAVEQGVLRSEIDIHRVCMDICTIVKGCVFEWCLSDGMKDVEQVLYRIVRNYLCVYLAKS